MTVLASDRPERFLLVVDDNRDYADALCELVALTSDWHPHAAYAVAEAVASAVEHWPDAVLLDLQMPPCTGFDAADALEKALPDHLPALLAVSGNSDLLQAAGRDKRFAGTILKPADPAGLLQLLDRLSPVPGHS
jgi:CheY-like chemotaxis protein